MMPRTVASVVWVGLMAVACLELGQASLSCFGGQEIHIANQLRKLDELIGSLTQEDKLPENIEVVKGFMETEKFTEETDEEFRKAIEWYSQLQTDGEHLCEPENLRRIRNLYDLISICGGTKRGLKGVRPKLRLIQQIQHLLGEARASCFIKLDARYRKFWGYDYAPDLFVFLRDFGPFYKKLSFEERYPDERLKDNVRKFNIGVKLLEKYQPGDVFSGEHLRHLLSRLNDHTSTKSYSVSEAEKDIDDLLIEPCESVESESSEGRVELMEAALNLGHMVKLEKSITPQGKGELKVGSDAAGYAVCQLLFKMGRSKLIEAVAEGS